jgi:hypothetical protein
MAELFQCKSVPFQMQYEELLSVGGQETILWNVLSSTYFVESRINRMLSDERGPINAWFYPYQCP